MSRTYHHGSKREFKIRIRAVKRERQDIRRLGRALIELAQAELEKEAECEHKQRSPSKKNKKDKS